MKLTQANTILVTFLMQLGDLVLTTPFLTALRRAVPKAKIVFLIDEKWLEIVQANPDIDKILTIDRKGKDKSFSALWKYTKTLQNYNFDYLINLNPSERCSFLAAFSGAKYKTGATHSLFKLLFDKPLKLKRNLHAAEMYLDILAQLGVTNLANDGLKIVPTQAGQKIAADFFAKAGVSQQDKLIGFNIGSASATKCWLPERFAKVADYVADKGYRPVFFGSKNEFAVVENTLQKLKKDNYLVATGQLTIGALVAALGSMRLLITNDSGPMHIAVSQKVPLVALYGPSKPELYGPYKAKHTIVVQAQPLCSGCRARMKHVCHDLSCMKNISSQQVIQAVTTLLEEEEA